jgi:hypothetical protein
VVDNQERWSAPARALGQIAGALTEISANPGEAVSRLRRSVPRAAVPTASTRCCPPFARGTRASRSRYSRATGRPQRPEDLRRHECITFRSQTTGALYAWELERGRRTWRVPVRRSVVTSDGELSVSMAEKGLGLAYASEPMSWSGCARGACNGCSSHTRPRPSGTSSTSRAAPSAPGRYVSSSTRPGAIALRSIFPSRRCLGSIFPFDCGKTNSPGELSASSMYGRSGAAMGTGSLAILRARCVPRSRHHE